MCGQYIEDWADMVRKNFTLKLKKKISNSRIEFQKKMCSGMSPM